ncbi:macrolide export ATP-binding/permease protein MacB [Azorhizobium oxalatiphilum]|uniref:Pyoverdine export ATP-binding/permease protein PvdT n=1 Tax=Azorhizobium oxalatiphilum TaxID=980631 RepID=A0A917C8K5_9HYPH|nr:MacB family efflux pump subunit [Azorhizobium oxalatiphilum]GGF77957.1 macrolide export ATP-binding/permease protein MacB [Azorhizobium oxalatiphilum]
MAEPLLVLEKVRREFPSGEGTLVVLNDIDLTIARGDMVAIVGASGSGKSTLMNILGCLHTPSSGSYRVGGRDTAALEPDELAALRRERFGFIFQRYHLLAELDAVDNVEIPAVYAGEDPAARHKRAFGLLARLGLADRADHRPGQLSGGQQQRVSIARALMNGGDVILADEPTGALDKSSGEEVLRILDELNAEGKTIIIVTHDMAVANRAKRIVELSDGVIISDRRTDSAPAAPAPAPRKVKQAPMWRGVVDRLKEAVRMAVLSMAAHRLRTFLTMLGIIIGIASVVCVVALGTGTQRQVLANISNLGTNTLEIFPGKDFGDVRSAKVQTLVLADARAIASQPYAAAVSPTVSTSTTVRFGPKEASALVNGVDPSYFTAKGTKLAEGRFFDARSVRDRTQEVVIDENTRKALFATTPGGALGKVLLVGDVPCRVIGITEAQQGGFGSSSNLSVYLPFTSVQARFLGTSTLRSITLKVSDEVEPAAAEEAVIQLLTVRHGTKDFFILNTDDIRKTITATTQMLTLLIAAIAVISLIVGGIGVMNIMLVSVSERIGEIGLRMAVGARRGDILQQFLIEAVLVCLLGGLAGIATALGLGELIALSGAGFSMVYSPASIVAAVAVSTAIGVVFGYLPARNASFLDPVVALSRD